MNEEIAVNCLLGIIAQYKDNFKLVYLSQTNLNPWAVASKYD